MGLGAFLLAIAGAGGVGWIARNVLGTTGWLENTLSPNIETGKATTINANIASYSAGLYAFRSQVLAPSDADIKGIDDFFESYGYNVNRFEKPNLKVRSTFTYIKTKDAVVYSSNLNAAQQMAAMLNDGCKFWVGDIGK